MKREAELNATNTRALGHWILLIAVNLCWAIMYPAYRVASAVIPLGALNFWSFAVATAVLLPFLVRERRRRPPCPPARASKFARFVPCAALGLIPSSVLVSWGVAHSSASNGAILTLAIPAMMVVLGVIFLKEKLHRHIFLSLALALLGTLMISWRDLASGPTDSSSWSGNLALLAGGLGTAFYNTYGKWLLTWFSELESLVYGYLAALPMCAAISFIWDPVPFYHITQWPLSAWVCIVILGTLSWGVAMLVWMWLLGRLQILQISSALYLLPVLGVLVSIVSLRERLGGWEILGATVVLSSAYFSARQTNVSPMA